MLAALLLALREGLEAALIVGIIVGTLARLGLAPLRRAVWAGVGTAVGLSLTVGGGLYALGLALEGTAEQVFEGTTMLLAAGVLTWMLFWMQRHAPHLRQHIEAEVHAAGARVRRAWFSLVALAFFAVVREGVELALFLTALVFQGEPGPVVGGALAGLLVAVGLGWALYTSTLRLNLRAFFRVTTVLLLVFAAGLVAHGIHEFVEAGWLPAFVDPVWDTNPWLAETSPPGQFLKALFGYNGDPSLTEAVAYFAYLVLIVRALFGTAPRRGPAPAA